MLKIALKTENMTNNWHEWENRSENDDFSAVTLVSCCIWVRQHTFGPFYVHSKVKWQARARAGACSLPFFIFF